MSEPSPIPDFLAHYYDAARGPFRSLSTLEPDDAEQVLERIRQAGSGFASKRAVDYLAIRRELEQRIRVLFVAKGGHPRRTMPHYMILGACDWVKTWYAAGCEISLTYGDSFPAMRYSDGKPYRGQVYTLDELPEVVDRFGLPQDWNPEGQRGPDRYIEAQVWDDAPGLLTFE